MRLVKSPKESYLMRLALILKKKHVCVRKSQHCQRVAPTMFKHLLKWKKTQISSLRKVKLMPSNQINGYNIYSKLVLQTLTWKMKKNLIFVDIKQKLDYNSNVDGKIACIFIQRELNISILGTEEKVK